MSLWIALSVPMLFLVSAFDAPLCAQSRGFGTPNLEDRSRALHSLESDRTSDPKTQREKAEANRRQHELTARLAEFATCWNKLAGMVEKGIWNTKQAKKTREAFERLVHTEGWMEDGKETASNAPPH